MKRLWVALGILAVLLGVVTFARYDVEHSVDRSIRDISQAVEAAGSGDMTAAVEAARLAEEQWVRFEKSLSAFIEHNKLDDIGVEISRLGPMLKNERYADFFVQANACNVMLIHLRDSNSFVLKNLI